MHCWYALHQAPTSVSIEVSSNGYQWEEIVPASNLDWLSTENNIEVQTFNFETVTNIRYLKLRIYDANLKWKHFAINELEVYHAAE